MGAHPVRGGRFTIYRTLERIKAQTLIATLGVAKMKPNLLERLMIWLAKIAQIIAIIKGETTPEQRQAIFAVLGQHRVDSIADVHAALKADGWRDPNE